MALKLGQFRFNEQPEFNRRSRLPISSNRGLDRLIESEAARLEKERQNVTNAINTLEGVNSLVNDFGQTFKSGRNKLVVDEVSKDLNIDAESISSMSMSQLSNPLFASQIKRNFSRLYSDPRVRRAVQSETKGEHFLRNLESFGDLRGIAEQAYNQWATDGNDELLNFDNYRPIGSIENFARNFVIENVPERSIKFRNEAGETVTTRGRDVEEVDTFLSTLENNPRFMNNLRVRGITDFSNLKQSLLSELTQRDQTNIQETTESRARFRTENPQLFQRQSTSSSRSSRSTSGGDIPEDTPFDILSQEGKVVANLLLNNGVPNTVENASKVDNLIRSQEYRGSQENPVTVEDKQRLIEELQFSILGEPAQTEGDLDFPEDLRIEDEPIESKRGDSFFE